MATQLQPQTTTTCPVPWFQQPQKLRVLSAASTNATLVKGAAATLVGYWLMNTAGSTRWMKFYDLAAAPVVGTSPVDWTLPLPPNLQVWADFTFQVPYYNGLAFAITASEADSDATAIGAGDVNGVLLFS
jgi:hypothetical protein